MLHLFLRNSDQAADFGNRPTRLSSEAHFSAVIANVNAIISDEFLALNLHRVASVITFIRFRRRYPKNSVNLSVIGRTSGLITA